MLYQPEPLSTLERWVRVRVLVRPLSQHRPHRVTRTLHTHVVTLDVPYRRPPVVSADDASQEESGYQGNEGRREPQRLT